MKAELYHTLLFMAATVAVCVTPSPCFGAQVVSSDAAHAHSVKMLPGENWWGLGSNFGREMPPVSGAEERK